MKRLFLCLWGSALLAHAQVPLRGYSPEQAAAERVWEDKLRALPEPARIKSYLQRMSRDPHVAGSPGSKAVAEYARGLMQEWGLDVQLEEFEALLPYPTLRVLEMTAPVKYRAQLQEPVVASDPTSAEKGPIPTYNAYSATGDVTAPLVYVNYGIPSDYDLLAKLGIDVKGKIVIARYGGSWRGVKPKVAYEHGALGCLIYSDPRDDGYFAGDVYPAGPFRPTQGVQRGSVMDMALSAGDPLSPGWPSVKGSKRLSLAEAETLMKLPVLPISYGDAQPLLAQLGGPVAPEPWRGALPITYHLGPGQAQVHLKLDFDWSTRPLYDVIATIPGRDLPDQWIVYGNHHDAWVNGAHDPLSGASALLETARAFATLRGQGWQPQRTIKLCLWDGEEFGLVGSTEWVEQHQDELAQKAVAYFNSDSNGKGTLGVAGSPVLHQFITEVMRDVPDPVTGKSVLETSQARRSPPGAPSGFRIGPLGSGSDYVAFAHHVGIASVNMGFGGGDSGGVYHSIYDSFAWYTKFSDSTFIYGRALSQVFGTAVMRLANAPVLPFEFAMFAKTVQTYVDEIRKEAGAHADQLALADLQTELTRTSDAAAAYEAQFSQAAPRWGAASSQSLADLNRALYQTERMLLLPEGLPGRPWYRSQLSAPGKYTGYGAKTLPGIREAVEASRYEEANAEVKAAARAIRAFHAQITAAMKLIPQ